LERVKFGTLCSTIQYRLQAFGDQLLTWSRIINLNTPEGNEREYLEGMNL